jgi:alpha-D-xyloside xylohydrolase
MPSDKMTPSTPLAIDTWTGTSMRRSSRFRHTVTAAEAVADVARCEHGLLLTMRTGVWGYDRPAEFADVETLRKRLADGEPLYYRIRFCHPGVVRIELTDAAGLNAPRPEFFLNEMRPMEFQVDETEHALRVTFGDHRFEVEHGTRGNGRFRFRLLDADGEVRFETENQEDGMVYFNYPPGKMTDHDTGKSWFRECIALTHDERIYGFGEKFHHLDKRGRDIRIWHTDSCGCLRDAGYKNIPFYLSPRRYGALFNSPAPMRFEVGSHDTSCIGVDIHDDRAEYLLIPGGLQEILQTYAELTNAPVLPPRWTFGLWMSKCTYQSEAEVREVVRRFDELDLPLTTLHIDTGWFDEHWLCDWQFNRNRFPEPEAMIRELLGNGLRVSLWQLPYVCESKNGHPNPAYAEGREGGYFAKDEHGNLYGNTRRGAETPMEGVIDFSNPEARRWYQGKIRRLLEMGVSCIKTDFGENAPAQARYRNIDGNRMHNLYPKLYNEAVWEVIREGYEQEPITWARSATVGCQAMPVHWGGDPSALWPHLAGSLWGGLSFGLSGGLFWSSDIGGFGGCRQPDAELYIRWLQFGTFNSHMRVHGNMPREPWHFGDEAVNCFRQFVKLRYRLLPYLVSEAKFCCTTMRPMMCAMPLAFEDDPVCAGIHDQYMFGRNILVAPILAPGGQRKAYLPPGAWFDYWTKEKVAGGTFVEVECPLDRYPLWVRDGAMIPMIPECNRLPEGLFPQLTVEVYSDQIEPSPYEVADLKPFDIRYADGTLVCSTPGPETPPRLVRY